MYLILTCSKQCNKARFYFSDDIGKKKKCQPIFRSRSSSPSPPLRARPKHRSHSASRSISSSPSPAKPRTKRQLPDRTRLCSTSSQKKFSPKRYRSRRPSISPSRFRGKLVSPSPMNRKSSCSSSESDNLDKNDLGVRSGRGSYDSDKSGSSDSSRSSGSNDSSSSGSSSDSDSDISLKSKSACLRSSQVIPDTTNKNKRY